MARRVTQADWDRRAAERHLRWLEPVVQRERTRAECLTCGHRWSPWPNNVPRHGCPNCAGQVIDARVWDARAAARGLRWLDPVGRALSKVRAECCACRFVWAALPFSVQQGHGCPRCAAAQRADALRLPQEEWDRRAAAIGAAWEAPVRNNSTKTPIRCLTCGHRWKVVGSSIAGGCGCPSCAAQAGAAALRKPQEDWDTDAAAVGLQWREPVLNANTPCLAECLACGSRWDVWPCNVASGKGCRKCAGRWVDGDEWRRRAAAVGIELLADVKAAAVPVPARCLTCAYEWMPRPHKLQQGGGCPSCANYGFDPKAPSSIYLVRATDDVAKIGITRQGSTRLNDHRCSGWEVVGLWDVADGNVARTIEQAVLRRWRIELCLPPARESGSGFTETVSLRSLRIGEITSHINMLVVEARATTDLSAPSG